MDGVPRLGGQTTCSRLVPLLFWAPSCYCHPASLGLDGGPQGKDSIAPGSSNLQGPSEPRSLVLPDLPGVSSRRGVGLLGLSPTAVLRVWVHQAWIAFL